MLFGEFDWGRMLIFGTLGGLIGGIFGVVSYLTKKKANK